MTKTSKKSKKQQTKKQQTKKMTAKKTKNVKTTAKTDTKKTTAKKTNNAPFVVYSCKLPDGQTFHKRFRENYAPVNVVVMRRLDKKNVWATLRWTSSEKSAQRELNAVNAHYIDKKSETFIEKRYAEAKILPVKFVRKMKSDESKLDSELTEDRTWAREIRKLRKIAKAASVSTSMMFPFFHLLGELTVNEILPFLPNLS